MRSCVLSSNRALRRWGFLFPAALLGITLMLACSTVSQETNEPPTGEPAGEPEPEVDLNHPTGNTAIVLGSTFTDPVGGLSLLPIDAPRTPTNNVQTTFSDAGVRAFGELLYVVNHLGADNIQVVDPASSFGVKAQFSVGAGTNPHQIMVTETTKGYVTLYQPEDNTSSDLTVDDLLVVNPEAGQITGTIDLTSLTADDGERLARADTMVTIGDHLFVALQDLPANLANPPDQPGVIAVIDMTTDAVVGSVTLTGKNPVAMTYSPETEMIYVALADYIDTSSANGGIEVVDPETLASRGVFLDDLTLGGSPGDLEVDGTKGFVTVGFLDENFNFLTKVSSFDIDPDGTPTPTEIYRSAGFIQEIAIDQNGVLLIGDRDPAVNGIVFVDANGAVVDGPINTGAAPSSITFIDR